MMQLKKINTKFTLTVVLIVASLFAEGDLKNEIENNKLKFSKEKKVKTLIDYQIKESMLTVSSFNYQCGSGEDAF